EFKPSNLRVSVLSIADPQQGRARGGILMRQVRTHLSNPPPGVSNGVLPSRGASGGTGHSDVPPHRSRLPRDRRWRHRHGLCRYPVSETPTPPGDGGPTAPLRRPPEQRLPFVRLHQPSEYYGWPRAN